MIKPATVLNIPFKEHEQVNKCTGDILYFYSAINIVKSSCIDWRHIGMGSNMNKYDHHMGWTWTGNANIECYIEGKARESFINLDKLQECINNWTVHAAQCGGDILLAGEKRDGLTPSFQPGVPKVTILFHWRCHERLRDWEVTINGNVILQLSGCRWWGHSKLQETKDVLGVPVMSVRHFIDNEQDISESWQKHLQVMFEAYKEEKPLSEKGRLSNHHEGVPVINVTADGG